MKGLGMLLRWSDGCSFAVEFDSGGRDAFENNLLNAYIDFRKNVKSLDAQLHVQDQPGSWVMPTFPPKDDAKVLNMNGTGTGAFKLPRSTWVLGSDTVSVNSIADPVLSGLYKNDWVLRVGPSCWHAEALYNACVLAIRRSNQATGFVADVMDSMDK